MRIHAGDAMQVIERMDASRFDLVLLDPPKPRRRRRPDSSCCARARPAPCTIASSNLLQCANR
ncbi:N6-adenine-specific methyltransferase [Bordetella pertussis]|nr:N6-adenine-specific methyltransferase [Bordetella pertussis]